MEISSPRRAPPPHVVVIPWMAQGHFIPMIDIARLLAERRSVAVTVITTPGNAARIASAISRLSDSGLPLRFATLPFPSLAAGLPEGCENLDSIPSRAMARNFYDGAKLLRHPLEDLLRRHPRPSCILSGIGFPWLDSIARELGVPRLVFQGFSCFSLLASHSLHRAPPPPPPPDPFPLPGIPHRVQITAAQLPKSFDHSSKFGDIYRELREGEATADGFVINSFEELEPGYADLLEKETGKKAWAIGPVSLASKDTAERGNTAAVGVEQCLRWLDAKEDGSVVYVSFGSMGRIESRQWIEMGLGLEATGRPFVWVVRAAAAEVERWLVSEGFEERMGTRCLVIRGWAPQVAILSHRAVGGFLTHCGWNSAIEGVTAGVPLLTWPLGAEQFLNEKMVVEVLGVGTAVGATAPAEEEAAAVVGRGEVEAAVERLMGGGEGESRRRRRRAKEVGELARRAVEEGGSSHVNLTRLISHVLERGGNGRGDGVSRLDT